MHDIVTFIAGFYFWFNQLTQPAFQVSMEDLHKYFTPDFVMDINSEVIPQNYDSLFKRFSSFHNSGDRIEIKLPLEEVVVSADKKKCVVRYNIVKTSPDHTKQTMRAIAIWHIKAENKDKHGIKYRFERMNEVVYVEPAQQPSQPKGK